MFTRRMALLLCALLVPMETLAASPPPPADASKNPDVTPLVAEVDVNKDGCMSREEWQTAGAPMSSYERLHDKRGCVTAEIMRTSPAPPGVDLNGDGKLTLAEMKAFDKKGAPLMKSDTASPSPSK